MKTFRLALFAIAASTITAAEPRLPDTLGAAEALFAKGRMSEALKVVDAFIATNPSDPLQPKALLFRGECLLASGKEQLALDTWLVVPFRFPKSPEAPMALAKAIDVFNTSKTRHNLPRAAELTADLLRLYSTSPPAARYVAAEADNLYAQKRYAEFIALVKPLRPSLKPEMESRMKFAEATISGVVSSDFLMDQASRNFNDSDVATAIKLYEEALQKFPASPRIGELKTKLGWCYYTRADKKSYEHAETLWQQVIATGGSGGYVGEARWHMVQLTSGPRAKWKEAANMCRDIARDFPGTPLQEQALYMRGWYYWVAKDFPKALAGFQELVKAFPEKARHPPIAYYISDCERNIPTEVKTTP